MPHVLGQSSRVPDSRASNGKCPTSIGTEPVMWNRDFMTTGRTSPLTVMKEKNVSSKSQEQLCLDEDPNVITDHDCFG